MAPKGFIPYGRQWIDADDERAVLSTLRSDFLTQGPATPRFEADLAAYVGARFAVAVSSANGGARGGQPRLANQPRQGSGNEKPGLSVAGADSVFTYRNVVQRCGLSKQGHADQCG